MRSRMHPDLAEHELAVLVAGGPVERNEPEYVPSLAHVRAYMPDRADRFAYLVHALRFFEDVLRYAERLEADATSGPEAEGGA